MKLQRLFVYIGLPLLIALSIWLYLAFFPIVSQSPGVIYHLKPGTSKQTAINELNQQGIIQHSWLFGIYAFIHAGAEIKSGEYLFAKGSTNISIWKQITTGTGLYYRRFTIVPGWTFAQVRKALSTAEAIRPMTSTWTDAEIMTAIGYHQVNPEGEFFPETYYYTRDNPDLVILKRAADLMQNQLEDLWKRRAADLPYKDKYQALIAASLIEKEAYLAEERPLIAGVLVNRLKKNMLLQFDPTVIYGLGSRYDGKIYKKDLLENTPYNTYVHKGLPPTPIGMPGLSSLEAAMQPATHDFLYFVARGNGSHQFSKNLSDHTAAVTNFRKKT